MDVGIFNCIFKICAFKESLKFYMLAMYVLIRKLHPLKVQCYKSNFRKLYSLKEASCICEIF